MRPPRCEARRLTLALVLVFVFVDRHARADDPEPALHTALEKRTLSYWENGQPRVFAAGRTEAGLYVKEQLAVGYGQPYWLNTTAEAFGISTFSFGGAYAGIRGTLPFLDLRLGTRYTYSYKRSFLPPKDHYTVDDVADAHGALAHYQSLEAELTGVIPAFDGFFFPVITVYGVVGVPEGTYVFDESLRGVLKPPWIMGYRLGYVKNFGKDAFVKAGVLTELVLVPGRGGSIFRMGPAGALTLTDHLDLQGTLSVVLSSPDSLGIFDGAFGVLGLVYRWATGDEHPAFP